MNEINTKTPYKIYGNSIEQEALDQFEACLNMPECTQGALMPDSHKGYTAPIGSVLKFNEAVSPQLVGYDIGCGVACTVLNLHYKALDLEALKKHILENIPIGYNGHEKPKDVYGMPSFKGTSLKLQDIYSLKGKKQLGTLGGGNHFIEVGYLESTGNVAIVTHSGSRGFGHGVATYYMQEAAALSMRQKWNSAHFSAARDFARRNRGFKFNNLESYKKAHAKYMIKQKDIFMKKQDIEGLHSLPLNSEMGQAYMTDMNFCLEYAILNRHEMVRKIVGGIMGQQGLTQLETISEINRNHNHAELVDGCVIHRKGATHAEKGMMGVIPGNMRDGSFIVKGKGNPDSMSSSSHGAGRVLSRKKAKATLSLEEFQAETAKLVTNHTKAMLDEAPKAYKDIFEVMDLQSDLVEVRDRVIPILNIKG